MRVISQDKKKDFPYEKCVVFINPLDSQTVSIQIAGDTICDNAARYSTKAKAVKAMEMLRKAYESNEFYHCMTATTDTFKEAVCLLDNKKFEEVTSECFQFPQDDEIEV